MKAMMSTCAFSLICLLVLSGSVRAQQPPDPPEPQPNPNYTCEGSFYWRGDQHTVTGEGDTCTKARDDFYKKAMKIILGRSQSQPTDGALDPTPIPVIECRCEDQPLRYAEPCYEVICTCITCDGFILYGREKGATIREASSRLNTRINLMLQAAGWRACTRSSCAVPIPKN